MKDKTREVFDELCKYVGTTYAAIESTMRVNEEGRSMWPYDEYTWSKAAEVCFKGWLMDKLKQRGYMRAVSGTCFSVCKKRREQVAAMFLLNYGWRSENVEGV